MKSRKTVNSSVFTFLPLLLQLLAISAITQSAKAATLDSGKVQQEKIVQKPKQKYFKNKSRKKRFFTCDSYSRNTLLNKANKYQEHIKKAAQDYNVSPYLITAVITVESCFRPKARSSSGAAGLMQLMPATAKRFGTTDRYNNKHNIKAGTKYLRFLLKRFDGNVQLAAAAYNAGEGAVDKYNGVPPYKETQAYVKKVLNAYRKLSAASTGKRIAKKPTAPIRTRDWYQKQYQRKQYERRNLMRGLNLTNSEVQHVDYLLQPKRMKKTTLSFKQFL